MGRGFTGPLLAEVGPRPHPTHKPTPGGRPATQTDLDGDHGQRPSELTRPPGQVGILSLDACTEFKRVLLPSIDDKSGSPV